MRRNVIIHCRTWQTTCVLVCLLAPAGFGDWVVTGPAVDVPGYSPNPSGDEEFFDVSADGRYMLFLEDHWPNYKVASRTLDPSTGLWGPAVVLFQSASHPSLGPDRSLHDGTTIFYTGFGSQWRSVYSGGSWLPPEKILDTTMLFGPFFTGSDLYMTQDYTHIVVSHYDQDTDTFGTFAEVDLGGDGWDEVAWVSRDQTQMIFMSNRSQDSYGGWDLYSATWDGGRWGHVTNLGPNVNTPGDEAVGRVAEDAGMLYFTRGYPWELMQAPVSNVPAPDALTLAGAGLGLVAWFRRRKG